MSERIFPIEPASESSGAERPVEAPAESVGPETPVSATAPLDHRKKRLPLYWIPVLICLGLLIAAGYLGMRIWSSHSHVSPGIQVTPAVRQTPITSNPVPESPIAQGRAEVQPVVPVSEPDVPTAAAVSSARGSPAVEDLTLITPQAGERYIQISALNTEAARKYVAQLRRGPLEPHVAPGPRPGIVRVLIGPFHDGATLAATRADLVAAGIDCFIREY